MSVARSLRTGNRASAPLTKVVVTMRLEVEVQVDEKSTVNEIMYARGSPRVRDARGFNFCAKILGKREREKVRKIEVGFQCSLNFELSRGFIAEGGPIVEIKGPCKS